MSHKLSHLMTRVFGVPLLIDPAKAEVILEALRPRLQGTDLAPMDMPMDPRRRKPYDMTPDGIAVVNIMGTLVKRAIGMEAMSGLSSYAQIESEFMAAVMDDDVKGIMLDVDSPGGEAGGVFDLANQIYRARSVKPVWAAANDSAFSAAYAIASAADRIYVTQTGGVGSVGVIAVHLDQSAFDSQNGLKYTTVFAGERKADFTPHEPLSKSARAGLQEEVDRLYDIFTEMVARHRGMSQAAVKKTEAGLFFGEKAVAAGMADQVGTFGNAMEGLRNELNSRTKKRKELSNMKTIRELLGLAPKPEAATPEEKEAEEVVREIAAAHALNLEAAIKAEREQAAHVADLCLLGGPAAFSLAPQLIRSGATKEAAGKAILEAKAAAEPEIQSHILPSAGGDTQPRREDAPMVKVARGIAARMLAEAGKHN